MKIKTLYKVYNPYQDHWYKVNDIRAYTTFTKKLGYPGKLHLITIRSAA
jgi:hypothetical protein